MVLCAIFIETVVVANLGHRQTLISMMVAPCRCLTDRCLTLLMCAVFNNSWIRRDHDENQSTTPSRPLSLEIGGTQVLTELTSEMTQPQTYPSIVNSVGLPPLHSAPGKQISRATLPVKEKSTTASTWDLMDFTYNPSALAFGHAIDEISPSKRDLAAEHEGFNGNLSASEMEMRRQRRLRVFQEMTPTKTLQV